MSLVETLHSAEKLVLVAREHLGELMEEGWSDEKCVQTLHALFGAISLDVPLKKYGVVTNDIVKRFYEWQTIIDPLERAFAELLAVTHHDKLDRVEELLTQYPELTRHQNEGKLGDTMLIMVVKRRRGKNRIWRLREKEWMHIGLLLQHGAS